MLEQIFGNVPSVKVIRRLIKNYPLDYSKTQLCEVSGIQYNTLMKFFDNWLVLGILKKRLGYLYTLDKENKIVKLLFKLEKSGEIK